MDASTATILSSEWLALPATSWASFAAWLSAAFVLGLIHAFDADHVMALSVFATRRRGARAGAQAGLHWSLGHGLVLLVVGVALLFLGRSLSPEAALVAERTVGVVMVLLGLYVFLDLVRRPSHLHFHDHDDLPPHAHWHTHAYEAGEVDAGHRHDHRHDHRHGDRDDHRHDHRHGHEHGAVMVGALHGLAGSAPILAVLPVAARSPLLGIAYLIVFAIGVALAMSVVSGLLGHLAGRLATSARGSGLAVLRGLSAVGSVALGAWLVVLA